MTIKEIIDNAIIYGTILAFLIVIITYFYLYFKKLNKVIVQMSYKLRYYDIMIAKFHIANPSHPLNVFKDDYFLFGKNNEKEIIEIERSIKSIKNDILSNNPLQNLMRK